MNSEKATPQSVNKGANLLLAGELVAFPTETVYGLGADATNGEAVAAVFAVKGRPQFNPLIVHVNGVEMARALVEWNAWAQALAARFWPGPLTLVLRRARQCPVSLLASAGGDTLGLRMPSHAVALDLIKTANRPLAAPSANRSGRISPTAASHVEEELGGAIPLILDGGACSVGIESTVLDVSGGAPLLLRPGSITREALEDILQVHVAYARQSSSLPRSGPFKSPGMQTSHYAPQLPVRLNVKKPEASEAFLAFGPDVAPGAKRTINLSPSGNLQEAAAQLFAGLRLLDGPEFSAIAVMEIPALGLGLAINDRLSRAAAGKA